MKNIMSEFSEILDRKILPLAIGNPGIGSSRYLPKRREPFIAPTRTFGADNDSTLTYDEFVEMKQRLVPIQPQMEIQVSEYLPTETVQAKRHKRKSSRRWQKKWLKRFGTKVIEKQEIFQIGNKLIMSKKTYDRMMKELNERVTETTNQIAHELWFGGMRFS